MTFASLHQNKGEDCSAGIYSDVASTSCSLGSYAGNNVLCYTYPEEQCVSIFNV